MTNRIQRSDGGYYSDELAERIRRGQALRQQGQPRYMDQAAERYRRRQAGERIPNPEFDRLPKWHPGEHDEELRQERAARQPQTPVVRTETYQDLASPPTYEPNRQVPPPPPPAPPPTSRNYGWAIDDPESQMQADYIARRNNFFDPLLDDNGSPATNRGPVERPNDDVPVFTRTNSPAPAPAARPAARNYGWATDDPEAQMQADYIARRNNFFDPLLDDNGELQRMYNSLADFKRMQDTNTLPYLINYPEV